MSISFNDIPADVLTPGSYIEFDGSKAIRGLAQIPHVALIIAPRLSTGTVAAATPFRINSPGDAETKFGRGSIGSFMGKSFKLNNRITELWGIGVADAGGGTAATGVLTFTGPATAAGVIYMYLAGQRIPVAIASGTTAANALLAVLAEMANFELPVTGADGTGDTIDLTARNKGTTGNKIKVEFNLNEGESFPAGISVTLSTPMSGGATDGSVSGAIAALGDVQYHTIVSAWEDDTNMDLIEAELLYRWGPMVQKEGHAYCAVYGSQGTMTTAGNARNSFNSTMMGIGLSNTPTFVWAAAVAGVRALQVQVDPARSCTTLPIKGVLAPPPASQLERSERNILLSDGISTYTCDTAGNCNIERLTTTYQFTNSIADRTYLDIQTPQLLAALRYTLRAMVAIKYPRHKLASNGSPIAPGQAIVTPDILRSDVIQLAGEWLNAGWVENIDQFVEDLNIERSVTDLNRVDSQLVPDLINSFFTFASQIQFLL